MERRKRRVRREAAATPNHARECVVSCGFTMRKKPSFYIEGARK
jgi:hypothetical protein